MSYAHIKRGHLCNRMVDVSITIHLDDAKIEQVEQDPETFSEWGERKNATCSMNFLKVLFVNVTRILGRLHILPVNIRVGCVW